MTPPVFSKVSNYLLITEVITFSHESEGKTDSITIDQCTYNEYMQIVFSFSPKDFEEPSVPPDALPGAFGALAKPKPKIMRLSIPLQVRAQN